MKLISNPISAYYLYWGKAKKNAKIGSADYHLLPYHSLDVAAIGWELLNTENKLCMDLSCLLELSTEQLRSLFCYCLALHDLGKFSSAFQALYQSDTHNLIKAKSRFPYNAQYFKHDRLGYLFWHEYTKTDSNFNANLAAMDRREKRKVTSALMVLMDCTLGHHGTPINKASLIECKQYTQEENLSAAFYFIHNIEKLLKPDLGVLQIKDEAWLQRLKQVSWHLAGIAVLADWIGSDQEHFEYKSSHVSLDNYWKKAQIKASSALSLLGLQQKFHVAPFQSIQQHFGFKATPLQQWAEEVKIDSSPQLFILEDVTGAGKTEAALALTHRLMESGAADGFYFGLPTMATSNTMFDRVADHYQNMFTEQATPSIVLAHGACEMSERFKEIQWGGSKEDSNYHQKDLTATAQCQQWFSDSRKKALLASVGVGTIDQALLAVLPRKHQSLRVLGLHRISLQLVYCKLYSLQKI